MSDVFEYSADRYCSIYGKEIGCELCFETNQVSSGLLKENAVPELLSLENHSDLRKNCDKCPHSKMWEEDY